MRVYGDYLHAAGNTTTVLTVNPVNGSHGSIGGTPGYHDVLEQGIKTLFCWGVPPGSYQVIDPDGYSWSTDKATSISVDMAIRAALCSRRFGVVQLPNQNLYGFTTNPDNVDEPGNGPNN